MKQFLTCCTNFDKKMYKTFSVEDKNYKDRRNLVDRISYFLQHYENAVVWPLFVKSDIEEMVSMDSSLASVLQDLQVNPDSDTCKIRYIGRIYLVNEITRSKALKGYWRCETECGSRLLDPNCIEFLGAQAL